jgi:predicted nucleic acid-binding protein
MMSILMAPRAAVVDASAAIDTALGEEPWAAHLERLVRERVMLFAPVGFPLEVANGLLVGQRRGTAEVRAHLRSMAALEIELSDLSAERIGECITLAAHHGLTLYDAAYLHLAIELEAELVTGDKALARAARAEGLIVHD